MKESAGDGKEGRRRERLTSYDTLDDADDDDGGDRRNGSSADSERRFLLNEEPAENSRSKS